MADITSMDEYRKKHDRGYEHRNSDEVQANRDKQNKQFREQSHQVWEDLDRAQKLEKDDRIIIARRLHREVEKLLRAKPGLKKYEICEKAQFIGGYKTSQELHHLTLPPDVDPEGRRLRAWREPYRKLIKALAELSGVNVLRLVDEVTIGTRLHPLHNYMEEGVDDFDGPEVILATLQEAIDRVDRDFDVFSLFSATAERKVRRIKRGGKVNWPFSVPELKKQSNRNGAKRETAFWQEWEPGEFYSLGDENIAAYSQLSDLAPDDAFLPYVPHVYLGIQSTFEGVKTLTWDRYLWPYQDQCEIESSFDECKNEVPYLPWEKGCVYEWVCQQLQEENRSEKLATQQIMGRRLLEILQEPLLLDGSIDGGSNLAKLTDGRILDEVYEALEHVRIRMFEECERIIHPDQAIEFIRYLVQYSEEWPQWAEMLKEVGRVVEEEYSGDYIKFSAEIENIPFKDEWKKELVDIIDDMGGDLAIFERHHPSTVWLVIYPDPEFNGLVPAIYLTNQDGEGQLLVLSVRLLSEMSLGRSSGIDQILEPIIGPDGQELDLSERIRELIMGEAGFVIYEEWKRTAEFLKHNPVLAEADAEKRRLEEFLGNDTNKEH